MGYLVNTVGIFAGLSPCRNPEYQNAKFYLPEVYKGVEISPEEVPLPNCTMIVGAREISKFKDLRPGVKYSLELEATVEEGRYDEVTKRSYKSRTRFNLLSSTLLEIPKAS